MTTPKLATIERLIELAETKHVGPRLYLLDAHQRAVWDAHQHKLSAQMDRYSAYLEGGTPSTNDEELPHSIRHLLGMNRKPISIPETATSDQVRRIYEEYLDEY